MKNNKDEILITKDEFYRLVAKQSKFAIKDVKSVWQAIEQIFEEIIENEFTLDLKGFGKLYVKTIPERNAWDGINKTYKRIKESKRVNFKLAYNYRKFLKDKNGT